MYPDEGYELLTSAATPVPRSGDLPEHLSKVGVGR
jgi:hypothetical protein